MKNKVIIAVCLVFLGMTSAFSQIRSYVGIVRQQHYPETVRYFKEYRDELESKGYSAYAKNIDSYLKGSFGSGFVYVASDGTNYVITNRHVVAQAATASIEFENVDTGDFTKYENLKVLLTDDEIDIAILGFADGKKPFKKGLSFSQAKVSDGQEVWSAGFPGLGSEPVWQLGKGTVTNSAARIKDLLDPSISSIIQHSAQVDGGNSGGPLMIASSKGTASYEVVGVNTWKASWRDSTNFSIPASVVQNMISKVRSKSNSSDDLQKVSERAQKLAASLKDLNGNFTSIEKYISYERASTQGQKDFDTVLHFAPSKVRGTVLEEFTSDPADGLRYACAYQLWKKYSAESNKGIVYAAGEPKSADGKTSVDFTSDDGKKTLSTTWIKEHGLWRILELSVDEKIDESDKSSEKKSADKKKKEKTPKSGGFFGNPMVDKFDDNVLFAGADFSINGNGTAYFGGFDAYPHKFFGISVAYHRETVECLFKEDFDSNTFGMGFALRVPVKMNEIGISPYGRVLGNIAFGDLRGLVGYSAEVGLQSVLFPESSFHLGLGVGFKQMHLTQFADFKIESLKKQRDKIEPFTNRGISVYAILSF